MNNVAAERAVLAGMFQYGNNCYIDVQDIVCDEVFTTDINKVIFKCLQTLLEDKDLNFKPDIASILSTSNKLGLNKELEKDKGMLRAITNFPIEKENVRKECGSIYKIFLAKKGIMKLEKAKRELEEITGDEPLDIIRQKLEQPIFEFADELTNTRSISTPKIGVGMKEYINFLAQNKRDTVGLSTGFPEWDAAIGGGIRKGGVTLVGARSKVGKTFFSDNVGVHVSLKLGVPVLNLDTEMSREEHMTRIMANIADVNIDEIETGKFSEDKNKVRALEDAASILEVIPYYIESVAGKRFEEISAIIRRWIVKEVGLDSNGKALPCLIIYDYLKLMDDSALGKDMKEYQALGFQLTALNNMMIFYQAPCLSFVQLNRDGIDREDASAVSQSDRLIWFCHSFTILKKKSDEEKGRDGRRLGDRKMVVVLCRHGRGTEDGDYICLTFDGSKGRMTEAGLLSKLTVGGNDNSFNEQDEDGNRPVEF